MTSQWMDVIARRALEGQEGANWDLSTACPESSVTGSDFQLEKLDVWKNGCR